MERKKNPSVFIRNTYTILQRSDLNHIISWSEEGKGFIIHDLPKFESEILPQYFKHQKYTSFVRQLNMYGFHKQKHPLTENYFQHETFQRGQNLADIKRKPEKKKKIEEQKAIQKDSQVQGEKNQNLKIQTQEQIIESEIMMNPQQQNSQQINQKDQLSDEENSNVVNRESLSWLCEQAIMQNKILTKIQPMLLSSSLNLKKLRMEQLIHYKQDKQILQNSNVMNNIENFNSLCQIVKDQTMKLYSILDSINA